MESLVGKAVPAVSLISSEGIRVDLSALKGVTVIACYPFTGRTGHDNPPGWDQIPRAHGSTPQLLSFSSSSREFDRLGAKIYGLSFQKCDWQVEFAQRNALHFPLLSDHEHRFASALKLPTLRAGDELYLARATLIIESGTIISFTYPIDDPAAQAAAVLDSLEGHQSL